MADDNPNGDRFMVVDNQTNLQVGRPRKTRKGAQRYADTLDARYGAYRYRVEVLAGYLVAR